MAKRSAIGQVTFYKETPKKRPGKHFKKRNKRKSKRKAYSGQGK
jgi:hypothetical protein